MRLVNIVCQCFLHFLGKIENPGLRPRFSTLPSDLANVNEWKIMFDPSIDHDINRFLDTLKMCSIISSPEPKAHR